MQESKYVDDIRKIDTMRVKIIQTLEDKIAPLARATVQILRKYGTERGRFRKRRRELNSGSILIVQPKGFIGFKRIHVYFNGELVFEFDDSLQISVSLKHRDWLHLFAYKAGEWEKEIVNLYFRLRLEELDKNFQIDPESCDFYDHNEGRCSKPNDMCPCLEFTNLEVGK